MSLIASEVPQPAESAIASIIRPAEKSFIPPTQPRLLSRKKTVFRSWPAGFPYTAGDGRLRGALDSGDTVVVYKGGRHLPEVLDAVRDAGRLDDSVYGEQLGLAGEEIARADERTGSGPYMSTVIVPARRNGHRGEKL